jgi:hypothetical protein
MIGHDNQPLHALPLRPLESELARLCADCSPAAGVDAPAAVLGVVFDHLTAENPAHRALILTAMAAYFFHSPTVTAKPLYRYWLRSKPKVDAAFRVAVARLSRAPVGLWRVESKAGSGHRVSDLIGLGAVFQPVGSVDFGGLALGVGDSVLARLVPGPVGWLGLHPIGLTVCPSSDQIAVQVHALWTCAKQFVDNPTVEDVLRWSGHDFHRFVVEWSFDANETLPICNPLVRWGMTG